MKKSIAILAVCATAPSPVLSTPAYAFSVSATATIDDPEPQGPSSATLTAMRAECTRLAGLHGPNVWVGTLDQMSIEGTVDPLSIVASGVRTIIGDPVGVGTPVPEAFQVATEPYRVGGSVNMFALAEVVAAHYPDSEYAFTQTVTWNTDYAFACNLVENVPTPARGIHRWIGPSQAEGGRRECEEGNANPHPNDDRGAQCIFEQTVPAGIDPQERDDEFGSILQTGETATLDGFESSGGPIPVDDDAELPDPIQVVVCNSPGPKGGSWRKQNGYTGLNCTTTYYKNAPVGPQNNLNTGSNNVVTIPQT